MVEREAALKIVPRLHRTAADVPGAIRVLRAEQVLHLWFANSLSKLNVKPFNDILGRVVFKKHRAGNNVTSLGRVVVRQK
jgi:hypothetical protein